MIGSILSGLAIATGAFGAHGLRELVSPELLETWDKAVRYQMYHGLALLFLAWAVSQWTSQVKLLTAGGWLFLVGVGLFSGNLYGLLLTGVKWLGAITPVGGVAFVAGWICCLLAASRS